MKKLLTILIITEITLIGLLVFLSLRDVKPQQKVQQIPQLPAYMATTIFERGPIRQAPLGYFNTVIKEESESSGAVFVGTDPAVIPDGTYLYIIDIGFRVATADSSAQGHNIILYDSCDLKQVFIWGMLKIHDSDKVPKFGRDL